jgi:hypothetical protein
VKRPLDKDVCGDTTQEALKELAAFARRCENAALQERETGLQAEKWRKAAVSSLRRAMGLLGHGVTDEQLYEAAEYEPPKVDLKKPVPNSRIVTGFFFRHVFRQQGGRQGERYAAVRKRPDGTFEGVVGNEKWGPGPRGRFQGYNWTLVGVYDTAAAAEQGLSEKLGSLQRSKPYK